MKIDGLSLSTVRRAVAIYLDLAYGGSTSSRRSPDLDLPEDAAPDEVLALFQCERVAGGDDQRVRHTMRLGNRNYPFMKLVLQEHLVAGEFFFAVDTHDEMEIKPDFPDFEAWMAVRRFNRKLKVDIESQLAAEGVPTAAQLRQAVTERGTPGLGKAAAGPRILVVDDEEELADCVESLLQARGFRVDKAYEGRSAVAKASATRPDLIVLDYELPEMDGLEVIEALRANAETQAIPVLLTTASKISLADVQKAEGFLAKPYQEELLYAMVQRLIPQTDKRRP